MYDLPGNLYLVTIFTLFQGFLILLVVFLFVDKLFSSRKHRLEQETLKQQAYNQALEELNSAKLKAYNLTKDAQDQAIKMLSEAATISSDLQNEFKSSTRKSLSDNALRLNTIIEDIGKDLKTSLDKEKITSITGFSNIVDDFRGVVTTEISEYRQVLTQNTLNFEELLKNQAAEYLQNMRKNIQLYEKQRQEALKLSSLGIINKMSRELFGENMTKTDHESLIVKLIDDNIIENSVQQ